MHKYWNSVLNLPASVKFMVLTEAMLGIVTGLWSLKLNFFLVDRGLSVRQIGEIIAFGSLITALFAVPCGSLADKLGYKRGMVLGCFLKTVAMVLTLSVPPGSGLYLARLVDGIANCFTTVCAYPYIVSRVEGEDQNLVYTLLFAVSMAAQFGGNIAAGLMAGGGFRDKTVLLASTGVVALVAILRSRLPGAAVNGEPGLKWYLPRDRAIGLYLLYETLGYGSYFLAYAMLNLILRNYFGFSEGVTGGALGGMTLVSGIAILLVPALTGRLDRITCNRIIIFVLILLYPIMAFASGRSFLVLAVGTAALQCMMGAVVNGPMLRIIPEVERGGFSGLQLLLINLGSSAGIFAAGHLINTAVGIQLLYWGVALLMVLQLLIFIFGFQRILEPER